GLNGVDGGHRRILDHLRHGVTPEAVALRGRAVGEHRQMTRGVVQARELEPGVCGRALLILRREGRGVAAFEILPNGGAMGRAVDDHEPPRQNFESCNARSEEHTSELQSLTNIVCRLLLEKKKMTNSILTLPKS